MSADRQQQACLAPAADGRTWYWATFLLASGLITSASPTQLMRTLPSDGGKKGLRTHSDIVAATLPRVVRFYRLCSLLLGMRSPGASACGSHRLWPVTSTLEASSERHALPLTWIVRSAEASCMTYAHSVVSGMGCGLTPERYRDANVSASGW